MVFILLIRSLYQLSRPGRAAAQVCISRQLAGTSRSSPDGTPATKGPWWFSQDHGRALTSDRAVVQCLALYGILKAYCLAQIRGSKLWADWFLSFFLFFDWFLSVVFNQKSLHPKPPIYTPSAKPVPCLRCLCFPSLMLDLCPLQGVKPGLLGLLQKDC